MSDEANTAPNKEPKNQFRTKEEKEARIKEIEEAMYAPDFWQDSHKAQEMMREMQAVKAELEGGSKYAGNDAILTIVAGAGGDDAEDFAGILLSMYRKYAENKNWTVTLLHQNQNDNGGFRNLSIELEGKNVYGTLSRETGVHRLVRISPFNAKGARHTSFVLVDVVPKIEKADAIEISPDDLEFQFVRSSGAGGQNVNKRETAVRIVHKPTNIAVHCEAERTQERNRDRALSMLMGKLVQLQEEERKLELEGLTQKPQSIEWGNQIRSYVFHPYQMIKDHRTNHEVRDIDRVLNGDLQEFIDAEAALE